MTAERRDAVGSTEGRADESVPPTDADAPDPSDAFGALGSETRLAVVRSLADDSPRTFSALFDATDEDTSAGFAYHLRQLTDRFVRQRDDERYELTDAGRSVARALEAGTLTRSVDRDPIELDDDCPFCGEASLAATVADNVTAITCEHCESPLLRLSLPPSGYASRDAEDLPDALDAHHRRRIDSFGDGVCPACAGAVSTGIEAASVDDRATHGDEEPVPVQTAFECESCGAALRCPVALTLLDHPAVVSFYHDHDRDVRDRPIWNVGSEWRERVVSRDPWCVVVSVRLDGDDLICYVAGDGRVVDHRRAGGDDSDGSARTTESADLGDADAESGSDRSRAGERTRGEEGGTGEASA
ncbi:ArsR/SmtB family transcription factor [Halosimplex amylolyticum]|uniref:ArsR/SmtB family transcription factor n=1 Tax=Halosimplex amylolyticum TaxID=3396616 RepID=UPI003F549873